MFKQLFIRDIKSVLFLNSYAKYLLQKDDYYFTYKYYIVPFSSIIQYVHTHTDAHMTHVIQFVRTRTTVAEMPNFSSSL